MTKPTEKLIDRAKFERVKEIAADHFESELLQLRKLFAIPKPLTQDRDWLKTTQQLSNGIHKQLALCVAMTKTLAILKAAIVVWRVLVGIFLVEFSLRSPDSWPEPTRHLPGLSGRRYGAEFQFIFCIDMIMDEPTNGI
jgi:hypothetical protein